MSDKAFHSYLISGPHGVCITEDGLDEIWPPDDREALITPKWLKIPPTCTPDNITYEESVGRDTLISFVFDGPDVPSIPLPPSGAVLLLTLAAITIWRKL